MTLCLQLVMALLVAAVCFAIRRASDNITCEHTHTHTHTHARTHTHTHTYTHTHTHTSTHTHTHTSTHPLCTHFPPLSSSVSFFSHSSSVFLSFPHSVAQGLHRPTTVAVFIDQHECHHRPQHAARPLRHALQATELLVTPRESVLSQRAHRRHNNRIRRVRETN
jgi:hypothetical protein